MEKPKREYKGEIKYAISLNEEQKEAKRLIIENQIVIITGAAGSGKTTINAQCGLDFINKGMCDNVFLTRPLIEVGKSLGYLPGELKQKQDPYFEAFMDCISTCIGDKTKFSKIIEENKFKYLPIQFIRGRTINDYLFLDEAQSTTPHEMEAILTRLGKSGKIVICGDLSQKDISLDYDGLTFAIELSKRIPEIKHIKLQANHRSDLVKKIIEVKNTLRNA